MRMTTPPEQPKDDVLDPYIDGVVPTPMTDDERGLLFQPEQPNAAPQDDGSVRVATSIPAGAAPDPQEATPRTDALYKVVYYKNKNGKIHSWIAPPTLDAMASHATLEREAAALRSRVQELEGQLETSLHNHSHTMGQLEDADAKLAAEVEARRVLEQERDEAKCIALEAESQSRAYEAIAERERERAEKAETVRRGK